MFRRLNLFFFSLILNGEPVTVFYVDLRNMSIALLICIRCSTLGTLRYGDYGYYGLRTTDGRHFRTGTRHMCSVVPTVASSRRCVVEGFHVVQRGVVRGTEDGMKK